MKLTILLLTILLITNCNITFNETVQVYTSEISDVDRGLYIYTENGKIEFDTLMFDSKIYASPVYVNDNSKKKIFTYHS